MCYGCAPGADRTPNRRIRSPALYPIEVRATPHKMWPAYHARGTTRCGRPTYLEVLPLGIRSLSKGPLKRKTRVRRLTPGAGCGTLAMSGAYSPGQPWGVHSAAGAFLYPTIAHHGHNCKRFRGQNARRMPPFGELEAQQPGRLASPRVWARPLNDTRHHGR